MTVPQRGKKHIVKMSNSKADVIKNKPLYMHEGKNRRWDMSLCQRHFQPFSPTPAPFIIASHSWHETDLNTLDGFFFSFLVSFFFFNPPRWESSVPWLMQHYSMRTTGGTGEPSRGRRLQQLSSTVPPSAVKQIQKLFSTPAFINKICKSGLKETEMAGCSIEL